MGLSAGLALWSDATATVAATPANSTAAPASRNLFMNPPSQSADDRHTACPAGNDAPRVRRRVDRPEPGETLLKIVDFDAQPVLFVAANEDLVLRGILV